ncbi:MAG: hypothetical protein QXO35_01650 [Candidatus Micrarchaeia archaeon]
MSFDKGLSKRVPELIFRLQFGDSYAATQLSLIAESKPLILDMLRSKDPIINKLPPIIISINPKNRQWMKRIAIEGGMAADKPLEQKKEKALEQYVYEIIKKWKSNKKPIEESIKKDVEGNLLSKQELNEIIRTIPKEEIERIKKDLMELKVELSNKNIAAYYYHEREIRTSWLVNTTYGILTRNEVRASIPSEETEKEIKKIIESCIRENKTLHLIGFWGGYKESKDGNPDLADEKALDRIKSQVERLRSLGLKVDATLFLADLHAISPLMGRSLELKSSSTIYLAKIKQMCNERDINYKSIAESFYGFSVSNYASTKESGKEISYEYEFKEEVIRRAKEFWKNADEETKATILKAAEKHTFTEMEKEEAALGYIGHRLFEKEWLETLEDSIIISYGSPRLAPLLPTNTLFWYSVGNLSNPPWYMEMSEI